MVFLYELYASTRVEELAVMGWTSDQLETFLRMQFRAQHIHYQTHFGDGAFDVVIVNGSRVGRLYVHRSNGLMRIVDISLLPEYRGRGIGSKLIADLQATCKESGSRLGLHVERSNPARNLYARLGFVSIRDESVYLYMEWDPQDLRPGGVRS